MERLTGSYQPERKELKVDLNRPLTEEEEAALKEAMQDE
jgi:hypothetical protein